MTHLLTFQPMTGMVDSPHELYVAHGAEHIGDPTDTEEAGRVEWVPMAAVLDLISKGGAGLRVARWAAAPPRDQKRLSPQAGAAQRRPPPGRADRGGRRPAHPLPRHATHLRVAAAVEGRAATSGDGGSGSLADVDHDGPVRARHAELDPRRGVRDRRRPGCLSAPRALAVALRVAVMGRPKAPGSQEPRSVDYGSGL